MSIDLTGRVVRFSLGDDGLAVVIIDTRAKPPAEPPSGKQPESLADMERETIQRVLADSKCLTEAADRLGINLSTLWRKRRLYKLQD